MKKKTFGFTLIELLVVIVILGILSTIGFANFKSYFGQAFDAEKKAAIKAMSTMVKVDAASDIDPNKYDYSEGGALAALFEKNDYKFPSLDGGGCYIFAFQKVTGGAGSNNEFAFATILDNGDVWADGTNKLSRAVLEVGSLPDYDDDGFDCSAELLPDATGIPNVTGDVKMIEYTATTNEFATAPVVTPDP